MLSGICTWITSAPQSASWRAAVGPARTCVMSMTRKRDRAAEAGMCGTMLCVSELAEHPVDDALEERGVGVLGEDHELARAEALREVGAGALEHRLPTLVGEQEPRLERAHVEQLRGLARLLRILRSQAHPDALLELARQLHFLGRYWIGAGGARSPARRRERRGRGRDGCRGRRGGEVELVGLLDLHHLVADLHRDRLRE